MAKLPSDEAVRARAEQLGLAGPGGEIDPRTHRSLMKDLLDEAQREEAAQAKVAAGGSPALQSIASVDVTIPDVGMLHLDITLTPTKESPRG